MESSRDGCSAQRATIKRSSTMQAPQRIYHTGFPIPIDNAQTSQPNYSRPSARRSHRQSIMHSSDTDSGFRLRAAKRVSSRASIRTSVPGMKSLLPLQLASPASSEFSDCPSVKSAKRSTFGLSDPALPTFPTTQDTVRRPLAFLRLPLVVRREKYRDTPIYSEAGSPVPSPAYYQAEFQLDSSSSSDGDWVIGCESPITDPSELSPSRCLSMDAIGASPLCIESLHMQSPTAQEVPRSSELSFNCLGEQPPPDEATWLKSVAAQTAQPTLKSLPELLAQKMPLEPTVEGWLSETGSDGEQEDANAYATALSPTTTSSDALSPSQPHFPVLAVKIPPRSSSLCGTRPVILNYEDRDNWMEFDDENITPKFEHAVDDWTAYEPYAATFHSSSSDDEDDYNSSYSPFSPSTQSSKRSLSHPELRSLSKRFSALSHLVSPPPVNNPCSPIQLSVDNILSLLEEATSDISSDEALRGPPLISSMRAHLHPTPTLSNNAHRKASLKRRVTMGFSSLTRSSNDLIPLALNLPSNNLDKQASNNHFNTPLNLEPLSRIFPYAPYYTLSSIYSHILAYIFVQHLKSFKASTSSPNASRPTSSISGSPTKIPAKAASMLGITTISIAPDVVDLDEDYFLPERIETVSNQLVRYIAHLSRTMRPASTTSKDLEPDYDFATELLLRALVEVVTNCEIQSFNL